MNEWLEFVSAHPPANPNAALAMTAMAEHRLLQVTGRDAQKFLQGQLSCDLRRLEQQDVLFGAHCNPKGRMISSATIAQTGETSIGLRVRANIAEPALAALHKYIVFSKAAITPATRVTIALLGDLTLLDDDRAAAHSLGDLPAPGKFMARDDLTLVHHASGLLEVWAEPVRAQELWQQLSPLTAAASPNALNRHWVEQGIAEVQAATAETFIPQMLNYHLIDGVSFKKGCYTGQEIVARMQYRGQLKKHTYRISGEVSEGPQVGEDLVCASNPEKVAATVVASAADAVGWTGLVVATGDIRDSEAELVSRDSGAKFRWDALPYAIS